MTECLRRRLQLAEAFRGCGPLMAALGDETRQQIVIALLEGEQPGLRVGEISARTHLSRPAVSHHLRILREAGVVDMRRRGTMNFYFMSAGAAWRQLSELARQVEAIAGRAEAAGYPHLPEDG